MATMRAERGEKCECSLCSTRTTSDEQTAQVHGNRRDADALLRILQNERASADVRQGERGGQAFVLRVDVDRRQLGRCNVNSAESVLLQRTLEAACRNSLRGPRVDYDLTEQCAAAAAIASASWLAALRSLALAVRLFDKDGDLYKRACFSANDKQAPDS